MSYIHTYFLFLFVLLNQYAFSQSFAEEFKKQLSLDNLYAEIANDLKHERPLIVAAYYGMWFAKQNNPEENLNWGMRDSHYTMMKKAKTNEHIKKKFTYHNWSEVYFVKQVSDPLRIVVFKQMIKPNARWQKIGVTNQFPMYLVMFAYTKREKAGEAMAKNLFDNDGLVLKLNDGTLLDVGKSKVVGYMGHNFFYDFSDFSYPSITLRKKPLPHPKGVFAVACKTGRVPGFIDLIAINVYAVLFTKSFMAVEGHATLALIDGIAGILSGKEIATLANDTYSYFRKLSAAKEYGRHFISHDYKLFDDKK